ncbi:MAG: thioredoxin domain-containing protein [Planctomycetota bacterium]
MARTTLGRPENSKAIEEAFRKDLLEPSFEGWLSNRRKDNFKTVHNKAKEEKRPFIALWLAPKSSGQSRRLAFTTLAAEAAQKALEQHGFAKMTMRVQHGQHTLAREYGVKQFPTLLIIAPDGKQLRREGYVELQDFLDFLTSPTTRPAATD